MIVWHDCVSLFFLSPGVCRPHNDLFNKGLCTVDGCIASLRICISNPALSLPAVHLLPPCFLSHPNLLPPRLVFHSTCPLPSLILVQAVSELLTVLGATGNEAVQIPAWHYTEEPDHTPRAAAAAGSVPEGSMSLRHALTSCYDLHTPKAEPLLQLLLLKLQQESVTIASAKVGETGRVANGTATGLNGVGNHGHHYEVVATAAGSKSAAAVDVAVSDQGQKKTASHVAAAAAAGKVDHIQQLLEDKQALEAYLAERHVVDILRDFASSVDLSVQQVRGRDV